MDENIAGGLPETLQPKPPTCRCCLNEVGENDAFCGYCGYPLQGTEQEKEAFFVKQLNKKLESKEARDSIRSARISLIVVAIFVFIGGVIFGLANEAGTGKVVFIISIIISAGFGALAWWSEHKPFAAVLIGTIVFVSLLLLGIINNPDDWYKGMVINVLITASLVRALVKSAKVRQEENG